MSDFLLSYLVIFFFNDTATTEIYTLSLHDALPIYRRRTVYFAETRRDPGCGLESPRPPAFSPRSQDRKSTRLNSSHVSISYAVFCLKKKKKHLEAWIISYFLFKYFTT